MLKGILLIFSPLILLIRGIKNSFVIFFVVFMIPIDTDTNKKYIRDLQPVICYRKPIRVEN